MEVELSVNNRIFGKMSYGVYAVTSLDGIRPAGCICNSVMQITPYPVTVAVSMSRDNFTDQCIERSGVFAYSILSEQTRVKTIGILGFRSGKELDKFEEIEYEMAAGVPVLKDSCGYVVCRVINKMEACTHTVYLGEVVESHIYEGAPPPMTYAYYHQVIKGKSPKNAPTYAQEAPLTPGKRPLREKG